MLLFPFVMHRMLLAELAMLLHRKLLFHLLLVALGIVSDASAVRTLQLRHVVLDLAHSLPGIPYEYNATTLRNFYVFVNTEPLTRLRKTPARYICHSIEDSLEICIHTDFLLLSEPLTGIEPVTSSLPRTCSTD